MPLAGRVSPDSINSSAGPVTPQSDLMLCRGVQVPVVTAMLDASACELTCSTHPEGVKTVDIMPNAHDIYPQGDCGNIAENVATATLVRIGMPFISQNQGC